MIHHLRYAIGVTVCGLLCAVTLACDSGSPAVAPTASAPATATTAATPAGAPVSSTGAAPTSTILLATDTAAPPPAPTAPAPPPSSTLPPPTAAGMAATATPVFLPATAVPAPATAAPGPPTAISAAASATPAAPAVTAAPQSSRVAGDLSEVLRVAPGKHRIALTFDAGSTVGHIPEILTALQRYNAHITFFVTGQWAEQNPDPLRMIVAAGDEIANHSYSHPSFPKLTDDQMVTELQKCETIIQTETGTSTKPYWRPPFGDETGHVQDVARAQGYRSIYWTWDSLDSIGKPKTKDFILARVTEAPIQLDGAIILQHVASDPSAAALPEILDRLYAQGLRVVTISELLAP